MAVHQFKYGDYLKSGIGLVKSNLVPSAIAGLGMMIPVVGASVMVNYLKALKGAKGGTPIEIGGLFKLDNLVPNFIAWLLNYLGCCCCAFPGMVIGFTMPIMSEKPGCPPMNAVKGAFAFGKANLVGMIITCIVCDLPAIILTIGLVIVNIILQFIPVVGGILALVLALLFFVLAVTVLLPIMIAGIWSAYDDARSAVEASAAEGGVSLA